MLVYEIKIIEGNPECYNHAVMRGDLTICGEDVAGDDDREIRELEGKITCPRCIELILFCQRIDNFKDIGYYKK